MSEAVRGVDLRHLFHLCDGTGILQHATFAIPCRSHGYCTDDAARALVVAVALRDISTGPERERLGWVESTMLAFLLDAFNPEQGRFRNFMSYDRRWLEERGSDDSWGRGMWGLGTAAACGRSDAGRRLAREIFDRARPAYRSTTSLRSWAYALLGYAAIPETGLPGELQEEALELVERLLGAYRRGAQPGWNWCESVATYDNAIVPLALLRAGRLLDLSAPRRAAEEMGEWLFKLQKGGQGQLSLIGNQGWCSLTEGRARFDQQPIDAASLAMLAFELWRDTADYAWWQRGERGMGWFRGANDLEAVLVDSETGGCRDGLTSEGVNMNQGAESTLAWLMARHAEVLTAVER